MSFLNPAAFYGLLFIPTLLIIHFLQRKSLKKTISTSFLLTHFNPPEKEGRQFEKIRNTTSLWLQILAILLLVWVLLQPQFIQNNSELKVVLIIDNSLSMNAYKNELLTGVEKRLKQLNKTVAQSIYYVLPSDHTKNKIYTGKSLQQLLIAIQKWEASSPNHNHQPTIEQAKQLTRKNGKIIYFTDHLTEKMGEIEEIAIGKAKDNTGFMGCEFFERDTKLFWRTYIRNYSKSPKTIEWSAKVKEQMLFQKTIQLKANELKEISGAFPQKPIDRFILKLKGDDFKIDDTLPIIRPLKKQLNIHISVTGEIQKFLNKMFITFNHLNINSSNQPDLQFSEKKRFEENTTTTDAIVFLKDTQMGEQLLGNMVNNKHPLMEDLNFQALRVYISQPFKSKKNDQVLLWQGSHPLLFLRQNHKKKSLYVNFSLKYSNASRVPAFIILLHRFIEEATNNKVAKEKLNCELSQKLSVKTNANSNNIQFIDHRQTSDLKSFYKEEVVIHAPHRPSYFKLHVDGKPLLEAACHFADANEANLSHANSGHHLIEKDSEIIFKNSSSDPFVKLWILLIMLCLMSDWFIRRRVS